MAPRINIYNMDYSKCNSCHKCMRQCGVKAMKKIDGKVGIMNTYCIGCGHCMEICPQNCKTYRSDLEEVKEWIAKGEKVYLSLDPAYPGIFDYDEPGQLVAALKKLGFVEVRETSEGAEYVTREYAKLLTEGKMDNIITTCCSSSVTLIEKHYPQLIPYMAPVVSHVVAHARLIKKVKGADVKVVYAGPCLSRKVEQLEFDDCIDGALGFQDLEAWFEELGIQIKEMEPIPFNNPDPKINQLYAISGGVIRTLKHRSQDHYQKIAVSGVNDCRELLHSIKKGYVHNTFVEIMVCPGGCVNGPCIDKNRGFRYKATLDMERCAIKENPALRHEIPTEKLHTDFQAHPINEPTPSEEELYELYEVIGNIAHTPNLDCGACGFDSCKDKAISMFRGHSEKTTCLMYSYEKARSMANLVVNNTPHMIMIVDPNLHIVEFNPKSESVFKISKNEALNLYLFDLIDSTEFENCLKEKKSIFRQKKFWKDLKMMVLETIVYVEDTSSLVCIIEDVTAEENERERMMNSRIETVQVAQTIIEKQMITAQQIAGLLGETTAETKVILTQLKNYLLNDEEM